MFNEKKLQQSAKEPPAMPVCALVQCLYVPLHILGRLSIPSRVESRLQQ
jgi:hypothetical protein